MKHVVYLALGSNLGDRRHNLAEARAALEPDVHAVATSSIYETPPWGYEDQPEFLNQVVKGKTELKPHELMRLLKAIEKRLGRQPTFRYGPRHIDLDLLFYDDLVIDSPGLAIPHPRLEARAFVLVPMAELAPDFVHPVHGLTVSEMLAKVDPAGIRQLK